MLHQVDIGIGPEFEMLAAFRATVWLQHFVANGMQLVDRHVAVFRERHVVVENERGAVVGMFGGIDRQVVSPAAVDVTLKTLPPKRGDLRLDVSWRH